MNGMRGMVMGWMVGALVLTAGCAGMPGTAERTLETQLAAYGECSSYTPFGLDGKPIRDEQGKEVFVTDAEGRVDPVYLRAVLTGRASIEPMLDCAFEPALSEEARLYRGHVIVSLLATYAAFNLEVANYDQRTGDALRLLGNIEAAERGLRGPSTVVKPDVVIRPFQGRPPRIERVVRVLEVAVDAERPTYRRLGTTLKGMIGAFATGGTLGAIKAGFDEALVGLNKTVLLDLYGPAYFADAKEDLRRFSGADARPRAEDWRNRDAMIEAACGRIAAVAGVEAHCIPQ